MRETLQTLHQIDLTLTKRARLKSNRSFWWRPAVILSHSGDSWLWATGMALVWWFSRGTSPLWHRNAAVLEISIVIQALFVFALKQLIRRARPEGDWGGIYRHVDPHSFPSGHATRAAMLCVMSLALGPAWFSWLILAWAPLVCLSRVLTGVHYLSDILGGIALGLLLGYLMLALAPLWVSGFPFLF